MKEKQVSYEITQEQVSRVIGLLGYLNRLDGFMEGMANDVKGISKEKSQKINDFRLGMVESSNDIENIVFIELNEQQI